MDGKVKSKAAKGMAAGRKNTKNTPFRGVFAFGAGSWDLGALTLVKSE